MRRVFLGFLIGLLIVGLFGGVYYIYRENKTKKAEQSKIILEEEAKNEHEKAVADALDTDKIYDGITVGGLDVSGLSIDEAKAKVNEKVNALSDVKVVVNIDESSATKTLGELGLSSNADEAVNSAYSYGRDGDKDDRFLKVSALKNSPQDFPINISVNEENVNQFVNTIADNMTIISVNPSVSFVNGKFNIGESKEGREVDREELLAKVKEAVNSAINGGKDVSIETATKVIKPNVNQDSLKRVNGIIGQFTSNLGRGTKGRNQNIILSAKKISNIVVMPGESISFNQMMGPITEANGYHQASTIQNGVYEDALGGGLCQTSTTLYNALVKSDVKITERHPHSIPAPYVPIGEDGAVWVGAKDLKFTNNFDFPIAITSSVNLGNNTMTFTIYGDTNTKDYTVNMYSKVTETIPFNTIEKESTDVADGEKKIETKGRNGYRVQSFKVYKRGGQVIKTVPYMKSYYPPANQVVLLGKGAKAAEKDNKEETKEKEKETPAETKPTENVTPEVKEEKPKEEVKTVDLFQ